MSNICSNSMQMLLICLIKRFFKFFVSISQIVFLLWLLSQIPAASAMQPVMVQNASSLSQQVIDLFSDLNPLLNSFLNTFGTIVWLYRSHNSWKALSGYLKTVVNAIHSSWLFKFWNTQMRDAIDWDLSPKSTISKFSVLARYRIETFFLETKLPHNDATPAQLSDLIETQNQQFLLLHTNVRTLLNLISATVLPLYENDPLGFYRYLEGSVIKFSQSWLNLVSQPELTDLREMYSHARHHLNKKQSIYCTENGVIAARIKLRLQPQQQQHHHQQQQKQQQGCILV